MLPKSVKMDLPKIKEDKDEDKDDLDKNKLSNNASNSQLKNSGKWFKNVEKSM